MSWEQLLSIYREQAEELRAGRDDPPQSCPNDGEPLTSGPNGSLRCTFDGWQWPEGRIVA